MTTPRDDDALSWDGDDDPTLEVGGASDELDTAADASTTDASATALPEGYTAVGRGADSLAPGEDEPVTGPEASDDRSSPHARAPMGNAALIATGVIGGVYALWTIGWIIGGLRLQGWRPFLVTDAMYQGSLWLAILAPALWFGTTFLLTRRSKPWVRFAWLAAGLILLVPWPFAAIGTVGQ
ncbi:DNA polymerase III subunit gamma/tau [Microbacterium awajiense]|uniref:DNA polymerase III subunit gamma/tau n=1 Tax=Microbacterium awajiense TaxID=415214 RepID=UPI0031DAB9E2